MAEPTEFEKLMAGYANWEQQKAGVPVAAPTVNLPKDITGLTEKDLAKLYSDSRSSGFNDAQIREAANARYGKQSDTTWDYLTSLAGFAPPSSNAGVVGDANKGVVAGPTSLTTDPLNFYTKQFQGKDYSLDTTIVDKLTQQILAQNTTSRWSGEGFGSAQANARAMAENLYASGVKDIKDVGLVDKTVDETVIPQYERTVLGYDNEGNQIVDTKIIGYTDLKGNKVDANLVKEGTVYSGGDAGIETIYNAPVGIQKIIGNKATGQSLLNDYGERGGVDNAWSGTYSGKGNTAYRVKFDDKGNPYFYTTGASSNDLVNLLGNDPILNAIAQIGATFIAGPAGNAALNLAMGKDFKDIAKSTALSYLGNEAFKGLTTTGAEQNLFGETGANFAKDIKDVFGKTGADIVGKTAGSYIASGGNADLGSLLLNQGVGAATTAVLGEIPGFDGLNATEKKFVTNIVSSTLNDGKLSPNEAISAAFSAATQAMKNTNKSTKVAGGDEDDVFKLPDGTQVAGPYSIDVAGVPLFQETVPKGFTPPAGLRLLSANELKDVYDTEGKFLRETKPVGSYLDDSILPGKSVWVVKDDALQNFDTGNFANDIAMFYQNQGDLDKIAQGTPSTFDDELADLLKYKGIKNTNDLNASKLTDDDLFAMFNSNFGDSFAGNKKVKGDNIDSLDITGKRIPGTIGALDTTKKDDKKIDGDKKVDDIPELVVTGKKDDDKKVDDDKKKDCPEGYVRDAETGQCVLPTTTKPPPIKCGEGFKLSADGKSCVPIVKTSQPIKCTEGFELSADGKSCVPIKKKTAETTPAQGQNAPSQDPYANIKLMEELFGGDIAYKLRSLGAPQNLASADIDALERLLRG
jgi:hypothetical protein